MVDISEKADTDREAIARGAIHLQRKTLRMILEQSIPKGDVLAVARVAGIMAAKGVDRLIPLCHPLFITSAEVTFRPHAEHGTIELESRIRVNGKTGRYGRASVVYLDMEYAEEMFVDIGADGLMDGTPKPPAPDAAINAYGGGSTSDRP